MMLKNRRRLGLLTCGVALSLAALTGCSSGTGGGGSGDQPLIGLSMRYVAGNAWLTTLTDAVKAEGKQRGYAVEADDAQGTAATQIQQIHTLINKGAKAIIMEPVGDRNVAAGINAAKKAGVPVIVVNDRVAPELATKVTCNVFDDGFATAKQVGARTAEVAASRYAGAPQINLYIQALFPQELVTQTREGGFMEGWNEYFKAHPGPRTNRIPNNYGQALPDTTLTAMRNVLAGNPDIHVIFNQTDVVMGAVNSALRGAGLMRSDGTTKVTIAGFDGGMHIVTAMAKNPNSPVVADGLNQPATQAGYAVEEAIAAIKGQPTGKCEGSPPNRVLPPVIATPDNAREFVNPGLQFAGSLKEGQR